jgi:hypothetical protein
VSPTITNSASVGWPVAVMIAVPLTLPAFVSCPCAALIEMPWILPSTFSSKRTVST